MIIDFFGQFTGGSGAPGNNDGATDSPTTGTQGSSNILDLHMAGIPVLASGQGARDLGIGDDPALKLMVEVTTAFTGGTSLQIAIQGSPDNGSGAPLGFQNYVLSAVVLEASLIVGSRLLDIDLPRPPPGVPFPRFLTLAYISAGTHGAGKLRAALVLDRHDQPLQANAILGGYPAGVFIAN